jgi:general secretion pathway protein C
VATSLSLQGLKDLDFSQILHRLMRRQNIVLITKGVRLLSMLVATGSLVWFLSVAVRDTLSRKGIEGELEGRLSTILNASTQNAQPTPEVEKNWRIISDTKVFGTLGVREAPTTQATPPPSPLSLTLIGTFVTEGQEPYAIIEDKKKQNQDMFLLGDSVFDQATLKKIYQDRVEIERLGKLEVLKLDEFGGPDAPAAGGIANNGDDYVVDEAELDKGLENLPLLLTQARAVPYFKDGRSIGLRLFAIKSGSLYEKIGLKNGDILKSINGNSLADITQALKLFEQLKQERSIGLVLERDKQDREFKYTIR